MALPTMPSCWPTRNRALERQIVRQREQEAQFRQQWDINSRYFREFDVWSSKQAQWSSRTCYQKSMQAYEQQKLKEEKKKSLAERQKRLCKLLSEERNQFTKELKEKRLNVALRESDMRERSEKLKSAREQERKTVAEQLLYEHWKKTNPRFRQIESALHRKHVVDSWESQLSERKQQEAAEKEEKIQFENQYEVARREAMERMTRAEEKRRLEDSQQAEALRQQMEELRLKELEATKLKKEQENLLRRQWELGLLEEERRNMEECRKKAELGRFLRHQYNAQLNRRTQQIQEELVRGPASLYVAMASLPLSPSAPGLSGDTRFPDGGSLREGSRASRAEVGGCEVLTHWCSSFLARCGKPLAYSCPESPLCGAQCEAPRVIWRLARLGHCPQGVCGHAEHGREMSEAHPGLSQEADRRILLALLEKEDEDQRRDSARREQAAADAAWMKQVIEDQLEVERAREAELQLLYREEAKRMWEKREAEWERERQARDRLMKEVLAERQHQLQEKIELNRRAQQEALKCREQLIRGLEEAREEAQRGRAEEVELKTIWRRELESQVSAALSRPRGHWAMCCAGPAVWV
uniref:Trichoplein keratin filament-binding protein n=1 Tax=Vombatus ursinus TaxID=29139 RepID=A0A4X2KIZ7_VOMUR